jgi:hypothetical protein
MARNVMPKALTKQAAASPLVNASTPTASGVPMAASGCGVCAPDRSAWNTIHSDAKPFSGGRAVAAADPTKNIAAVCGIPLMSPPSCSMFRVCVC